MLRMGPEGHQPGEIVKDTTQQMGILSIDTQYRYLYFNERHESIMLSTYGQKPKKGKCIFDLITLEKDVEEVKGYYDRALNGEAHISFRTTGTGRHTKYYETFYNPIFNKAQEIIGVSIFAQDITERRIKDKYIKESESMRELLLDIITHDLKNPAGVIMGMADLLKDEFPDQPLIDGIYQSSERLVKVLDDTTLLSQATFGESIPKSPQRLLELMEDVVTDFQAMLDRTGMTLEYHDVEDLEIIANPLISEVFKNFISNAIKYASHGRRISIESKSVAEWILISVSDLGDTIPEDQREAIFERRTQLAEKEQRGRGLGLAIVKRIAEAHKGRVWVEPNDPQGNRFFLKIPVDPDRHSHLDDEE